LFAKLLIDDGANTLFFYCAVITKILKFKWMDSSHSNRSISRPIHTAYNNLHNFIKIFGLHQVVFNCLHVKTHLFKIIINDVQSNK